MNLVCAAISSGIFSDLGSGSNVDVSVITDEGTEDLRNYQKPNQRGQKEQSYLFPKGTTAFTKQEVYDMVVREDALLVGGGAPSTGEKMDTSG